VTTSLDEEAGLLSKDKLLEGAFSGGPTGEGEDGHD